MRKLTIITINRNNADGLDKTIKSVINQDYENYEYIIIDGASTDSSVNIIKGYQNRLTYWISEPDKGVYDAMNKGINEATGEWICFLNSGDIFCNENVLKNLFIDNIHFTDDADILYGNVVCSGRVLLYMLRPEPLEGILRSLPFSHQSSFIRTEVQKNNKFNTRYKICADHYMFLSLYKNKYRFKYIDVTISIFDITDSLSSKNANLVVRENYEIRGIDSKFKLYVAILKFKIKKLISRRYDDLCSWSDFLAKNKIKLMGKGKQENIAWVVRNENIIDKK